MKPYSHTKRQETIEENFRKTLRRDAILLILISMGTAVGIFFTLWAVAKGIID